MKKKVIFNLVLCSLFVLGAVLFMLFTKYSKASTSSKMYSTYKAYYTQGTKQYLQDTSQPGVAGDDGSDVIRYEDHVPVPIAYEITITDEVDQKIADEYWITQDLRTKKVSVRGPTDKGRNDAKVYFSGEARVEDNNGTLIDDAYLKNHDIDAGILDGLKLQFAAYSWSDERGYGRDPASGYRYITEDTRSGIPALNRYPDYPRESKWGVGCPSSGWGCYSEFYDASAAMDELSRSNMVPGTWYIKTVMYK